MTKNLFLFVFVATVACGTPPQNVEVITDTHDLCDDRLNVCTTLAAREIDRCTNRVWSDVSQECGVENTQCYNDVYVLENACREAEELCRAQGSPEIRVCTRLCRDTSTTAQAECTSAQEIVVNACGRALDEANANCLEQGSRAFTACAAPVRATQIRCLGETQISHSACVGTLNALEQSCRTECGGITQACYDQCAQNRETTRMQCETDLQLGTNACDDATNVVISVCNVQQRDAREACDGEIPAEVRTCIIRANRDVQLCWSRAGYVQEDCDLACDPLGYRFCNKHCGADTTQAYNECYKKGSDCVHDRLVRGEETCEAAQQTEIAKCFAEVEACKKAK